VENPVVHVELPVTDLKKAKQFYSKLFGWKIDIMPPPMNYAMFNPPPPQMSVGFSKADKVKTGGCLFYVNVDNIEKKLKEIKEAGGKTVRKKTEIPQMGWDATFKDIFGNVVGLFTPLKK